MEPLVRLQQVCCDFAQSRQANAEHVLKIGHDFPLPHIRTSQFIIHHYSPSWSQCQGTQSAEAEVTCLDPCRAFLSGEPVPSATQERYLVPLCNIFQHLQCVAIILSLTAIKLLNVCCLDIFHTLFQSSHS